MAVSRLRLPVDRPLSPQGRAPAADGGSTGLAEAVEVYHRTYTTLLRSTGETRLRILESSHRAMGPSLHPLAASDEPDLGAFLYASRRLPAAISRCERIVMGQSADVFARNGYRPFDTWEELAAPGRRRRWYDDGRGTLAVLLASASDVDDLVPTLVAYQIEWNKVRVRLRANGWPPAEGCDPEGCARVLGGRPDDWAQLHEMWGDGFTPWLGTMAGRSMNLRIRMLGGSQVGYGRVTRTWWGAVREAMAAAGVDDRPIYFVSSNTHSLVNLMTGTAARHEEELVDWVAQAGPTDLRDELRRFREGRSQGEWANFVYYAARLFYDAQPHGSPLRGRRRREETDAGVVFVGSRTALDVAAQVIALDGVDPAGVDARVGRPDGEALRRSRAVIVNIDYPLGLASYNILREVAESTGDLRGVYVLGKAATLNADVGDVMLSTVVHDEHSGSTYWLDNAFSVGDIEPWLRFGSGLDNQRTVTVKGTFLQNRAYLDFYYREAFTVVEMEAGPYCNAVYELVDAGRYPTAEPVNFSKLPIDLGVIHYASDTPYTQARTLGARGLSYFGMDSTYAASVAILRRILLLEGALGPTQERRPEGTAGEGTGEV